MERRYLVDVERAHGLPPGSRQVRLVGVGIADVVHEPFGVVVELDGRIGHGAEGAEKDARRDNRNMARGRVTLRYGWVAVTDGACATAAEVAAVLRSRGWEGELESCPRCVAGQVQPPSRFTDPYAEWG